MYSAIENWLEHVPTETLSEMLLEIKSQPEDRGIEYLSEIIVDILQERFAVGLGQSARDCH